MNTNMIITAITKIYMILIKIVSNSTADGNIVNDSQHSS